MATRRDLIRAARPPAPVIPGWLERIVSFGIVSDDPQVMRRQRCTNVAAGALAANAASHLVINALHEWEALAVIHVYNLIMVAVALTIPHMHRLGENIGAIVLVFSVLAGNAFVVWMLGITSNLHIYFTLIGASLFMLGVQSWRLFLALFALSAAALLISLSYAPHDGLIATQDRALRQTLSAHAMINVITINAVMVFYALTALHHAELELEQQYQRSELLVLTILPASIAARLRSEQPMRVADRINKLSVMFTDLVGFTEASQETEPEEVVEFLDRMVRSFEELCEAYGVEKIKTIGDGFMAAAGFEGDARDGAVRIGHLALAMQARSRTLTALSGRVLKLRVGLHSGDAMAGVIGGTRFSYDVWGNAVNIASRMETYGTPGRIHVSKAFRELAADSFDFEARDNIQIKGIGLVSTYYLVTERSETPIIAQTRL